MSISNLFRNAKKNPVSTSFVVVLAIAMVIVMIGDIHDMREATTGDDYCQSFCYLFENICISYFMTIFFTMYYLTYINKQYSKWSIWLFYVLGVSVFVKFLIAGILYRYVCNHVESEFADHLPSIATTVYTAGIYWITIVFFLVPRFIKDTMKLKEEQDLTI